MSSHAIPGEEAQHYPVDVQLIPAEGERDRLTTAFRLILAFPHLLLVGGPIACGLTWASGNGESGWGWGGGGVLGTVAGLSAAISWFAILFTARHPEGLASLSTFYLRWRVRAVAYSALLRDEYPPFGDGDYAASLRIEPLPESRDRVSVAFRLILAIPHIIAVWALGLAWGITTIIAWFSILFTGRYPQALYEFAVGVFRWNIRVEAYLLLLTDEYPPFTLG
jgi:hypothetical protein